MNTAPTTVTQEATEDQMEALLARKLEDFRKAMLEVQTNTMKDLYVDALPYALADTQFNISYIVEECLEKILRKQFETKIDSYGNYCILVTDKNGYEHRVAAREGDVWENIVQTIFEANRSAVIDTRVRQLESRIEMLQSQLNNRY